MPDESGNKQQLSRPERSDSTAIPSAPIYNERGVIAENYHDLQGLGILEAARLKYFLPKASPESTVRALFQGVEIALFNLNDLLGRASKDLSDGAISSAVVKMFWARSFHRAITSLSLVPNRLGCLNNSPSSAEGALKIAESPAYQEYLRVLRRLDRSLLSAIDSGHVRLKETLAERSLEDPEFNLIHLVRLCNHESTIWEANLTAVPTGGVVPSYEEFVGSESMREAVYERVLKGDTYFTQFRGLHQIPETLGEEANNHCEMAILALRANSLCVAIEHLTTANILAETLSTMLAPMADSLATSDYHEIRENLGLTSGSHSVCLHYHLFTDLFDQLADALSIRLIGRPASRGDERTLAETVRQIDSERHKDSQSWFLHHLITQCLTLRVHVFQWRDEHLNMPRNNLGGGSTKSLTGSSNAVRAVRQMRASARTKDTMRFMMHGRGLAASPSNAFVGELSLYLDSDESLDHRILGMTGEITQERFRDVQERLGTFASRCPFTPPPRREV